MEELLPSVEHTHDLRDFYASDLPVRDEYLDPGPDLNGLEPEVQDDEQVKSSSIYQV